MLPWPLIPFLALPWIGAPAIDAGPEVHAARCGDARPWRAWVEPSGPGLLWVELEGAHKRALMAEAATRRLGGGS